MRCKTLIASGLILSAATAIYAKGKTAAIMTVDGEPVSTDEFVYLYGKNNLQQAEPQTIDEYLPIFEVFRLKVAEAKSLGVDTLANFRKEVSQYRKDLLEPYIADTVFFNALVDEALEREKTQVESSHIMIIRTNNPDKDAENLALLDSLHQELLNGADFISLAKQYSQDKFSSDKGGYLGYQPAGTFPYGFETAVYETPEGGISEIVESHVGWHIVKSGGRKPAEDFNRKPRGYADVKADVSRKVTTPFDSRYHKIRKNLLANLSKKHPDVASKNAGKSEEEIFDALIEAEENYQYANNPEYRNLVDEYTNGSLLFEVSKDNVWDKAANDTEGLQAFYESHRDNYKWNEPRAKGLMIQAANDSIAGLIRDNIAGLTIAEIPGYLKANYPRAAKSERFTLKKGMNEIVDYVVFGANNGTEPKNLANFIIVEGRIVDQPEELNDVRSAVVGDYQDQLESDWVAQLRNRHKVVVNEKELAKIRKKLK